MDHPNRFFFQMERVKQEFDELIKLFKPNVCFSHREKISEIYKNIYHKGIITIKSEYNLISMIFTPIMSLNQIMDTSRSD